VIGGRGEGFSFFAASNCSWVSKLGSEREEKFSFF
jgi:hypothetical protein